MLGEMAYLEAASVDAFVILAAELEAHGAPPRLVRAARRAARDEVRHARIVGGLAARAGAYVPTHEVRPTGVRSIEAMAMENAVEGCVRETFGAAVALVLAAKTSDAKIRRAMARIARDEARHAALAWQVAAWLEPQLDFAARRRIVEARSAAVSGVRDDAAHAPARELTERLGFPTEHEATAIVERLSATLWAA